MKQSLFFICISSFCVAQDINFDTLFVLPDFKKVVDTSMRIYSDLLILEEKAQRHERSDDLVDLIVGRLVRLQTYVRKLIYEYNIGKTVSFEELEYLSRLLEYMEITAEPLVKEQFPTLFNAWISAIKEEVKHNIIHPPQEPCSQIDPY